VTILADKNGCQLETMTDRNSIPFLCSKVTERIAPADRKLFNFDLTFFGWNPTKSFQQCRRQVFQSVSSFCVAKPSKAFANGEIINCVAIELMRALGKRRFHFNRQQKFFAAWRVPASARRHDKTLRGQ